MKFFKTISLVGALLLSLTAQAQVKISALPAGTTLAGTEAMPTVQSATTVKTTPAAIATYVQSVAGANPSATVGTTAVNGTATSFMRSDGAPAINLTMAPTMTGAWTFQNNLVTFGAVTGPAVLSGSAAQTPTSNGNGVTLRGGPGGVTSGTGGVLLLSGGTPTDGQGGNVNITAASAAGTNRAGGSINATGGNATGTAQGGTLTWSAGNGGATGAGGDLTANAGNGGATSGVGGTVTIRSGLPVDGNGGNITLTARNGVGTNRNGGSFALTTGTATGSGTAGVATLNGDGITVSSSGSWTATAVGCTTSPTQSVRWQRNGATPGAQGTVAASVVISINNAVTCTSNTTGFSLTGSPPTSILPATGSRVISFVLVRNSGATVTGTATMGSNGTIDFGVAPVAGGGFANTGVKGTEFFTSSYDISP